MAVPSVFAAGFGIRAPADDFECLRSATLLSELGDDALRVVARTVEWLLVPGGSTLLERGDVVDAVFFVASGRLRVLLGEEDDREGAAWEIGRGGSVGELAILTGDPRASSVRALRDTVLARLSRARFEELVDEHPRLAMQLCRNLARDLRVRDRSERRDRQMRTLAIVPLSRDAPLAAFASRLIAAVAPHGTVLHLTDERVESRFGSGAAGLGEQDPGYGQVTQWMNEQEAAHRLVIYESTAEPSAWARRCLRQADHVLAVALVDAGPRDSEITPVLFDAASERSAVDIELVMLHEDGANRPRASRAWLSLYDFAGHHHLRLSTPADFARLARALTGESVGLVLGGGGARAYAHIGVIRALGEAGVAIDRLGGTSMGAMIAAQHAYGYDWQQMLELNRTVLESRPLGDYTLPVIALRSPDGMDRGLALQFGDARIEDLWLPFFCVSTNLTQAEPAIHRDGPISRGLRASVSIPGIFPPVVTETGDLLVDGAILNNLPADVMRRSARGPVIAVDVTPSTDVFSRGYTKSPTPWRLVRDRVQGADGEQSFPSILQILLRATLLPSNSTRKRVRAEADLYLSPPVGNFDMFNGGALDRIAETGYLHARAAIAEWRATANGDRGVRPPVAT